MSTMWMHRQTGGVMQINKRRSDYTDETYQVDVVVSLFAILLVLLVVLASATAVLEGDGRLDYRTADEAGEQFSLSSIQSPITVRQSWIADGDWLFRIDLTAVAQAIAEHPMSGRTEIEDATVRVGSPHIGSDAPGSWRLDLSFLPGAPEGKFVAEAIRIESVDDYAAWAKQGRPVFLYVGPGARSALPVIEAGFRSSHRAFRIRHTFENRAPIRLSRIRGNFEHEKILRMY